MVYLTPLGTPLPAWRRPHASFTFRMFNAPIFQHFHAVADSVREDHVFLELKALLEPFGITRFYTDGWGTYRRHLDPTAHTVGKRHTQKIERKHTTLRARIKRLMRKTICFSRSILIHDLVIGLFINRYEFGYAV